MSGLKRFFAEQIEVGGECVLTGEEFEHARTVMRLDEGDEAVLLSGDGKEYTAIVTAVTKKAMTFHVLSARECDKEPKTDIALYFGFLKNADKNEFAVQKAVELGVSRIGLFASDYSSAYLSENKTERLKKVAREAAIEKLLSGGAADGVAVMIGSEGGFSEHEADEARKSGCSFVSLGRRILRAETAAVALLSVAAYETGELK